MRTTAKAVWTAIAAAVFLVTTLALSPHPTTLTHQVMTATTGQLLTAETATQTRDAGTLAVIEMRADSPITIANMKLEKKATMYKATSVQMIDDGATMPGAKLIHMPPAEAQDPRPILRI